MFNINSNIEEMIKDFIIISCESIIKEFTIKFLFIKIIKVLFIKGFQYSFYK